MFRFFVRQKEDNYFILDKDVLKHLQVARIKKENFICIYEQTFYLTKLVDQKALIIEKLPWNHEFKNKVKLGAALIAPKRWEWLIQKATELGASDLFPLMTQRVNFKITTEMEKKLERWNKIAQNAAEQSFRNKALVIHKPITLEEFTKLSASNKYIAHEKENAKIPLSFKTDCLLLVGPEGGFSDEEVKLAKKANFTGVSLGKRILRAETASIFMLSRLIE